VGYQGESTKSLASDPSSSCALAGHRLMAAGTTAVPSLALSESRANPPTRRWAAPSSGHDPRRDVAVLPLFGSILMAAGILNALG